MSLGLRIFCDVELVLVVGVGGTSDYVYIATVLSLM